MVVYRWHFGYSTTLCALYMTCHSIDLKEATNLFLLLIRRLIRFDAIANGWLVVDDADNSSRVTEYILRYTSNNNINEIGYRLAALWADGMAQSEGQTDEPSSIIIMWLSTRRKKRKHPIEREKYRNTEIRSSFKIQFDTNRLKWVINCPIWHIDQNRQLK